MPTREKPFHNGGYYHVYDKTIDGRKIFASDLVAKEFIRTFFYYRSTKANIRFSYFKQLLESERKKKQIELQLHTCFKVDIVAYCLMPNHYHFILHQLKPNGIVHFMSKSLNSITRYYNQLYKRKGPIFLTQFRSKTIYTEEQLVYVAQYIHTNPLTAQTISSLEEIATYPYSSASAYEGQNPNQIQTKSITLFSADQKANLQNFLNKEKNGEETEKYLKDIKDLEI